MRQRIAGVRSHIGALAVRHSVGALRLAPVAVAVAAALVLASLHLVEERATNSEIQLNRVVALVNRLEAIQWQGVSRGADVRLIAAFGAADSQAHELLAVLQHDSAGGPAMVAIEANFATYLSHVEREFTFLRAGDIVAAATIDTQETNPLVEQLQVQTEAAVSAERVSAAQVAQVAQVGSIATLLLSGLMIWALVLGLARSRRRIEEGLAAERARGEARFRSLIQNSSDVVSIIGLDGTTVYESPAVERVLGRSTTGTSADQLSDLIHPDDLPAIRETFERVAAAPEAEARLAVRIRHSDGGWRYIEGIAKNLTADPTIAGIAINYRDVSERHELESQLRHQAFHDPLTGLANRLLFGDRLEHALARALRSGHSLAVLFLDLDDFKLVNDSLGHAVGDRLLGGVAERLLACVRNADTVARFGGDEFALLLEDLADGSPASELAERITSALEPPFQLAGKEVFVRASVGIALSAGQDVVETVLRNADAAMYSAKAGGRGGVCIFEPEMHRSALERLELEAQLRQAVRKSELRLQFQPIVTTASGEIVGFEALVRWLHPRRGLLDPSHFIALAEETGLIVPLGDWVLQHACRQLSWWRRTHGSNLTMSVNMSIRQLQDESLGARVQDALRTNGLPGDSLTLEVAESQLMADPGASTKILRELKTLGIRVAVDDFGSGYSSLSYLGTLPLDILKIDRSFIVDAAKGSVERSLLEAMIRLSTTLGLTTTAEGVETEAQAKAITKAGCQLAQGYWYARPLDAELATRLLETWKPETAVGRVPGAGRPVAGAARRVLRVARSKA
jgi:diguanylate cyclase (GGDEF)-like protein/PAS domain S-box-containing protein